MLRAALAYVDAGWPIVPGATPYGSARRRVRITGPAGPVWVGCSCDSQYCMAPAAHPIDPQWRQHPVTTAAEVRWWWSVRSGTLPNIVLVAGPAFHVWSMPRAIGVRVMEALPVRVAGAVPVAVTPLGCWHLFTAPEPTPQQLPAVPARVDVVHRGDGCGVAAPPSTRGALGHDMWLREAPTRQRLPPCEVIAAALDHATHQAQATTLGRRMTPAVSGLLVRRAAG